MLKAIRYPQRKVIEKLCAVYVCREHILSALYAAPRFFSWDDAWNLWIEEQNDIQKLKAFHNNVLAEA